MKYYNYYYNTHTYAYIHIHYNLYQLVNCFFKDAKPSLGFDLKIVMYIINQLHNIINIINNHIKAHKISIFFMSIIIHYIQSPILREV